MTCDESLYRQYLSGDDEGLNALMKKYGCLLYTSDAADDQINV